MQEVSLFRSTTNNSVIQTIMISMLVILFVHLEVLVLKQELSNGIINSLTPMVAYMQPLF